MGLDLSVVMDAIAERLETIEGVGQVYAWPAGSVSPPAVVVGYPRDPIQFDLTFRRGGDRATFPVWVLVGKVSDRTARDRLSAYVSHQGVTEIKAAVDGNLPSRRWEAFGSSAWDDLSAAAWDDVAVAAAQTVRVVDAVIETVSVGGVDLLAARFDVDVVA